VAASTRGLGFALSNRNLAMRVLAIVVVMAIFVAASAQGDPLEAMAMN
jgi:hypothetical protein